MAGSDRGSRRDGVGETLMRLSSELHPVDRWLSNRAKWMVSEAGVKTELTDGVHVVEMLVAPNDGSGVEESETSFVRDGARLHVLCIGSGKGHEIVAMLDQFTGNDNDPDIRATALDPHDGMTETVRRRLLKQERDFEQLHASVHAADMKEVAEGSVDAITLFFVLHHVDPSEYAQIMAELHRVLKPGGKVFIAEDLADDDAEARIVEREDRKINLELLSNEPHSYKSLDGWRDFFAEHGFDMRVTSLVKPKDVRHGFFVLSRQEDAR